MVFVQMTVSGAVLILLIVLLRGIALKRLPKSIFPVLWGIALSRLLLPVVIPSAYSIYSLPVWKQTAAGLQSSYEAMQNPVDEENRERAGGPENTEEQKRTGKTENILNYEKAVTDRYASWEQDLTEREAAVREKERELRIGTEEAP